MIPGTIFSILLFLFSFISTMALEPPKVTNVQQLGVHKFVLQYESETKYVSYEFKDSTGQNLKAGTADRYNTIAGVSMYELGLNPGEAFTVHLVAQDFDSGTRSDTTIAGPYAFQIEPVGQEGNKIDYVYIGYSMAERKKLDSLIRLVDVELDKYITPAYPYTCRIIKDENAGTFSYFYPSYLAIVLSKDALDNLELVMHELGHGKKAAVLYTNSKAWRYNTNMSFIEEGLTHAITKRAKSNLDGVLNTTSVSGCYDFKNKFAVKTTVNQNTDRAGMLLINERYERLAQAYLKVEVEHPGYLKYLIDAHYDDINQSFAYRSHYERFKAKTIFYTQGSIEGRKAAEWLADNIPEPKIAPGVKIYTRGQFYPYHQGFIYTDNIYYYRTNANGHDWEIYDKKEGKYKITHNLNGSVGTVEIFDISGKKIASDSIQTVPIQNPPDYFGYASARYHIGSPKTDSSDLSFFNPERIIKDAGLYRQVIKFEGVKQVNYKPIGPDISAKNCIVIALPGKKKGIVSLYHNRQYYEAKIQNGLAIFKDLDFLEGGQFMGILNFEVTKGLRTQKFQRNVYGSLINQNSLFFLFS